MQRGFIFHCFRRFTFLTGGMGEFDEMGAAAVRSAPLMRGGSGSLRDLSKGGTAALCPSGALPPEAGIPPNSAADVL